MGSLANIECISQGKLNQTKFSVASLSQSSDPMLIYKQLASSKPHLCKDLYMQQSFHK